MAALAHQLTFDQLAADRRPPRPASPAQRQRAAERTSLRLEQMMETECSTERRAREIDRLRAELADYIAGLGVGQEFHACDFITRLHEVGRPPDTALVDPRVTGALVCELIRSGRIEYVQHRMNAGNRFTGYSATSRPVYRIVSSPSPLGRGPGRGMP